MLVRPRHWTICLPRGHTQRMKVTLPPVDPLGEALHFLRLRGTMYCRSECTAPWALALPPLEDFVMFHIVTTGRCWLEVAGAEARILQPGDFALVPHGDGHTLASERGVAATELFDLPREMVSDRYEILRYGGGGAATTAICGAVHFDDPAAQRLVHLLPPVITIDRDSLPDLDWMRSTLRLMAAEAQSAQPGGEAVITRLADILVIQAIRSWLAHDAAARTGWLGALQDPRIGRAIALIHRDPSRPWTVASLAAEAAMSRSAFAGRFTDLVGEPVMQYATRWRMQTASRWLKEEGVTIADAASRLGYESEAAFSRAFKRFVGVSPGAVRSRTSAPRQRVERLERLATSISAG
jgi:AraC-like DNA-binding protein